jgi:hypothetical protein
MFRPLTFVTLVMACGSGLYLYQVKHQAQVLDKQIDHTVKAIDTARAQVRELSAEWTLEGNPSRLQQLAEQFLPNDRPVQPTQFVGLTDLDAKLPAPRPLDAAPAAPAPDSGTDGAPAGLPDSGPDAAAPASVPVKAPTPTPAPAIAQAHPVEHKLADASRPTHDPASVPAQAVAPAPKPAPHSAPAPVVAELERPPLKLHASPPAPTPITGSLLGMAHGGASLPPPRPMPVSTAPTAFGNQ